MAEVQCLQNFINVKTDVKVSECLIKSSEVDVPCVNELHNQSRSFSKRISHDIIQVNDVDSARDCLQNFDLASDLSLLNRFQYFDNNPLVFLGVNSFVNF